MKDVFDIQKQKSQVCLCLFICLLKSAGLTLAIFILILISLHDSELSCVHVYSVFVCGLNGV